MTPEEKALEFISKYKVKGLNLSLIQAKQCALITIDEIEKSLISCGEISDQLQNMDRELNFWHKVTTCVKDL